MKAVKYIAVLFIIITFFSCKKTSLTITGPGPELFLNKMENNKWQGVTVNDNGNKITISTGSGDKNYTFEDNILGVGGIYKDDKPSGDDKGYIVTVPAGDTLYTVDMTEDGKKAINDILTIVGEDKALGIMVNIASNGGIDSNGNIDVDKLVGNSGITQEQVSQIESIVNGLPKGSFGDPDTIGTNKNPSP
ncbi:hypothetical protein [Brachyspira alvinipulli]|uniref:hypothetical protein n=1 Tax=Brachyspira alvinipulli TaxID=84379 RepID=UPI0004859D5B|nr:hypothetical protein [Brachyspira alvinipulli]